jgi:hypothetical protein
MAAGCEDRARRQKQGQRTGRKRSYQVLATGAEFRNVRYFHFEELHAVADVQKLNVKNYACSKVTTLNSYSRLPVVLGMFLSIARNHPLENLLSSL